MAVSTLSLLGGGPPKYDLVGPTVEDDVRRAINRYGANAVQEAVKKLAKPKRGRPKINDWREMIQVFEADALAWLSGSDPISARKNYSIAKEFAEKHPGQSAVSTHQRIERKLAKKPYDRTWYMLVTAKQMSRESYSWKHHIRALEELSKIDTHPDWTETLNRTASDVADYTAKEGHPPADALTMKEVEDGARNAMMSLGKLASGDFSGLLSSYAGKSTSQD